MPKVVGVKFKSSPKVYYFEAGEHEYTPECGVVVETSRGTEFGEVCMPPTDMDESKVVMPLKPILRLANEADYAIIASQEARYAEAHKTCDEIIQKSGLNMKLVDIEFTFDDSKLIVNFAADGRVDFRELVKKLAGTFRTRIELRQIGARDECRMIGGLGPCGRGCCCKEYLPDYTRVSIKMAKNQNLSLNPAKISGLCGRLMCCLEYENAHYAETNRRMPKVGANVKTADGREGMVIGLNQLKETVKLKIPDKETFVFADLPLKEVIFAKRGNDKSDDDNSTDSDDLKN